MELCQRLPHYKLTSQSTKKKKNIYKGLDGKNNFIGLLNSKDKCCERL